MITHYDMVTGEVIETESHHDGRAVAQRSLDIPAPGLMTIEEAAELEKAFRRPNTLQPPVLAPTSLPD